MFPAIGLKRSDQQLSEILLPKDVTKGRLSLLENLLSVADKKESRLSLVLQVESLEVKSSDHGFTGSGGGNYQIAPSIVALPLSLQRLKNTLLKGMRT